MTATITPPTTTLYTSNRACTACHLRAKCAGPVPGVGPIPADIMFVGEAPGKKEDETGRPFQGPAGQFLNALLSMAGVDRTTCYITNVVKCRPPGNKTPPYSDVHECAPRWLDIEVGMVKPRIIVAMGATAIHHLIGDYTVEHIHGKPFVFDSTTILPVYHPAAGLHAKGGDNTSLIMRRIQQDFEVLRELVSGVAPSRYWPVDEYAGHESYGSTGYTGLYSPFMAVDTEVRGGKLWSVQASQAPGSAIFMFQDQYDAHDSEVIVHNWLYDSQYINIPNFKDTMIAAYLLGHPQGLKELASRLCGMEMKSYDDMVRPYRKEKALSYLHTLAAKEWPIPLPIINPKTGKSRKPKSIASKVKRILADTMDKDADPWARWQAIPQSERTPIEDTLGPMPDADLSDIPESEAIQYACRDADATLRVWNVLKPELEAKGMMPAFHMDLAILPMVRRMMDVGIGIDKEHLLALGPEYEAGMRRAAEDVTMIAWSEATEDIRGTVPSINPNSRPQVAELLFNKLGFKPTKLTPEGLPSTDDQELKKIKHPVIPYILEYRRLSKAKGTYADALPTHADDNNRIHTTIKTTRTETGRLSMADPNLQQIPIRTPEGKAIRDGFVAGEGKVLLEADYSQIEMRVLAHIAQAKGMIQLFLDDRDIHTENAAKMFGVTLDQAKEMRFRYPAKTVGFGVAYGLTHKGLLDQMADEGWDEAQCKAFIADFYRLHPAIRDYQEETVAFARRHGYVRDMFGRRRYVPELLCPVRHVREGGQRQAINMPIQSGAQGIIKIAMAKAWSAMVHDHLPMEPLLQVHDSLLLEVVENFIKGMSGYILEVMENAVAISVPTPIDVKVGKRWGSMGSMEKHKEVEHGN